jgi:hypothetical protein
LNVRFGDRKMTHTILISDIEVGDKLTWKTRRGWPASGFVEQVDTKTQTLMVSKRVSNAKGLWTKNKWYPVTLDKVISIEKHRGSLDIK